jgi:hypothetical protein
MTGALSAVYSNDVVCLAMTPVVARLCLQRGLNPLPFLVGLACAANIGSVMQLHFADYLRQALPPVGLSLLLLWLWLAWGPGSRAAAAATLPVPGSTQDDEEPAFDERPRACASPQCCC